MIVLCIIGGLSLAVSLLALEVGYQRRRHLYWKGRAEKWRQVAKAADERVTAAMLTVEEMRANIDALGQLADDHFVAAQ